MFPELSVCFCSPGHISIPTVVATPLPPNRQSWTYYGTSDSPASDLGVLGDDPKNDVIDD